MQSTTFALRRLMTASLTLLISMCLLSNTVAQAQKDTRELRLVKVKIDGAEEFNLYDESQALVIGVSRYENEGDLPTLEGVTFDVDKVTDALKNHGFSVKILMNPTRKQFDETVRSFISKQAQLPKTRVVVYLAGHGYTLKASDGRMLGYFLPADTPSPMKNLSAFKQTAISMDEIEVFAKQMESNHALFMFDSCFSGTLFEAMRQVVPPAISEKVLKPVRFFITAGNEEQVVPDKSVFREQFVEALNGAADSNEDGYITGIELGEFLVDKVTNYSKGAQTPLYGKIRNPVLDKGDIVFVSSGSAKPNRTDERKEILEGDPIKAMDYHAEAWLLKKKGKTAEAEQAFRKALMYAPKNSEIHIHLAWHLFELKRYVEAAAQFRIAKDCDPGSGEAYRGLGWSLDKTNDIEEAANAFKQATQLEKNPEEKAGAHFGLGLMLERQGNRKGAAIEFQEALRLNPTKRDYKDSLRRMQ